MSGLTTLLLSVLGGVFASHMAASIAAGAVTSTVWAVTHDVALSLAVFGALVGAYALFKVAGPKTAVAWVAAVGALLAYRAGVKTGAAREAQKGVAYAEKRAEMREKVRDDIHAADRAELQRRARRWVHRD